MPVFVAPVKGPVRGGKGARWECADGPVNDGEACDEDHGEGDTPSAARVAFIVIFNVVFIVTWAGRVDLDRVHAPTDIVAGAP
jgi:hypothetical protein